MWAVALVGGFGWAAGRTAGLFDFTTEVGHPTPPRGWEFALALVGCLAIGFTEEMVWRGYLLTRIEALTGSAWQAVALTSLGFGLVHLYQGVGGVINAGLVGLMCGGAFVATRRLAAVALAHGAYDLLVMT